jgi:hypothetical protein
MPIVRLASLPDVGRRTPREFGVVLVLPQRFAGRKEALQPEAADFSLRQVGEKSAALPVADEGIDILRDFTREKDVRAKVRTYGPRP